MTYPDHDLTGNYDPSPGAGMRKPRTPIWDVTDEEMSLSPDELAAAEALDAEWDRFTLGGPGTPSTQSPQQPPQFDAELTLSRLHGASSTNTSRARRIWSDAQQRAESARRRPGASLGIIPMPMSPRDVLVAAALLIMVLTGAIGGLNLPGTESFGLSTASAEAAPSEPTATVTATNAVTATPPLTRDDLNAQQRDATRQFLLLSATATPSASLDAPPLRASS